MNIIDTLNSRKLKLHDASGDVRKKISEIIDDSSFVELGAFSFGKNEFYDEELEGLGVVTGYATVSGYPLYVVAQNGNLLNGGLSKANLDKISNCLDKAISTETPVIYLLDTKGVQVGEGVAVLEGLATVLAKSNELKGLAPQIVVAVGDVLGSASLLAANADYTYVVGSSCIAYASPSVLSASAKSPLTKEEVGGNKSKNGVMTFNVKELSEVKSSVIKLFDTLPNLSGILSETGDDLNRFTPSLNDKVCANCLIDAVYDKGTFIKMNEGHCDEVIVGVGRVGGISTAAVVFDGGEDGVELTLDNVLKIKNFANFVYDNNLPMLTFVNTKGVKLDYLTSSSPITVEIMNMLSNLSNLDRITVVYGKAIGLGYSAFASKEFGNRYTYAFAGSKISLLDGVEGISATFGTVDSEKHAELKEKYIDSQDSYNAAKLGCIDNIIEPQFVRQHIIATLQILVH